MSARIGGVSTMFFNDQIRGSAANESGDYHKSAPPGSGKNRPNAVLRTFNNK
ncbi:MAG: hypothetical protein VB957_11345 [Pseudomonadales bacterium]|jgi:hypothetical protein